MLVSVTFFLILGFWCPPIRDEMDPHHGIMKAFPKVKRAKVFQGKDPPPAKKKPDECDVTGRYQSGKRKQELWIVDLTLNIVHTHTARHTRAHKYLTALIVHCSFLLCLFLPGNTFAGVTAYVLPAGIGNARHQIFQRQIQQNGGRTENALSPGITHVVVDDNMDVDRAVRLMKVPRLPPGVHLVKCTWLSSCISEKKLLDVGRYSLLSPTRSIT